MRLIDGSCANFLLLSLFSYSEQAERDLGADEGAEEGRAFRSLRDQGPLYFRAADGQAENHLQGWTG